MLVLTRQVGESILIGDDVEIIVALITPQGATLTFRHTSPGGRERHEDSLTRELLLRQVVNLPVVGTCELVDLREDRVRLGISGVPKEVTVHRREVYEAIRREKRPDRA